jgi:hypothetical protein
MPKIKVAVKKKNKIKTFIAATVIALAPFGYVSHTSNLIPANYNIREIIRGLNIFTKAPNGQSCSKKSTCQSGNCQNGICCQAGKTCCKSNGNCPDGQACNSSLKKSFCEEITCDKDSRNICVAIVIDEGYYSITSSQLTEFKNMLSATMLEKTGFGVTFLHTDRVTLTPEERSNHGRQGLNYVARHSGNLAEMLILFMPTPSALSNGGHVSSAGDPDASYCNRFPTPYPPAGKEANKIIYTMVVNWNHRYAVCGNGTDPSATSSGGQCEGHNGTPCVLHGEAGYYVCEDAVMDLPYFRPRYFQVSSAIHELLHFFGSEGIYDHYGTEVCSERTGFSPYRELERAEATRLFQGNCGMCPDIWEALMESFDPESCRS